MNVLEPQIVESGQENEVVTGHEDNSTKDSVQGISPRIGIKAEPTVARLQVDADIA